MKDLLKSVSVIIGILATLFALVWGAFEVFAQRCEVERVEKQSIETFQQMQQTMAEDRKSIKCNRTFDNISELKDQRRYVLMLLKQNPNDIDLLRDVEELDKRIDIMVEKYQSLY